MPHLLLVEDDPLLLFAVSSLLEDRGHAVHAAPDAEAALAILARVPCVGAVVTDVDLGPGGADGVALAEQALGAGHPGLRGVVYATGHAERLAARPLGPREAVLAKPYTADALLAAVASLPPPS